MTPEPRRAALRRLAGLGAALSTGSLVQPTPSGAAQSPAVDPRQTVDCRDFAGLDPTGMHLSDTQINAALAAGVDHHLPVYLAKGTYRIANTLVGNPLAVKSGYANLQFFGAGGLGSLDPPGFSSRAHTIIAPTFQDRPALALDLLSGASLRDFAIQGLNAAPNAIVMPIDNQASYIGPGCRNHRHSPYCAISIDAFNNRELDAGSQYPGMASHYFHSGGGSAGITIANVWIANFVVGIAYGISGVEYNTEDILFDNLWISRVDTCYAVGQSQARHCMMNMGNLAFARQAIDGFQYGAGTGCPPKFQRVNHGYLYRIFSLPNTVGNFVLDDNYAESIRTLGNFGLGAGYSRQPLSFLGGDYTITSHESFIAPPPLLLESYSPTTFKATSLTRDANSEAVDALNVIAGDVVCSFEQCYLPGSGTPRVPPFIGLVKDLAHGQCRVTDCQVASAKGDSLLLSDEYPRSYGIAPFAPGGRFIASYQSRHVTDGAVDLVYQPSAAHGIQVPVRVSGLSLSTTGAGGLSFQTSESHLLAGDVLFWVMRPQGLSKNQWIVPALKVVRKDLEDVHCRLLFDPTQYDTVAGWNLYNAGWMFIAVRQWAPARELTGVLQDSTEITDLSAPGILIGCGPEVAGDWICGPGIPPNTRVVSVDEKAKSAVLSRATTGGPATGVPLYFGRLLVPTMKPAW